MSGREGDKEERKKKKHSISFPSYLQELGVNLQKYRIAILDLIDLVDESMQILLS